MLYAIIPAPLLGRGRGNEGIQSFVILFKSNVDEEEIIDPEQIPSKLTERQSIAGPFPVVSKNCFKPKSHQLK